MLTATRFNTVDMADMTSTYAINLQIELRPPQVIMKYSSVSNGTNTRSRNRSAIANDTRNTAVGERNLPCMDQVVITTQFPITPIKKVKVCVMIIGKKAINFQNDNRLTKFFMKILN